MRSGSRAQEVVRVFVAVYPVHERYVNGVFKTVTVCFFHRDNLGPHEPHAIYIGLLPSDVPSAHVDGAFHAKQGSHHGCGCPMLSSAGFCNQPGFPQTFGKKCLGDNLVAFVCTAVHQVFALEEDSCFSFAMAF